MHIPELHIAEAIRAHKYHELVGTRCLGIASATSDFDHMVAMEARYPYERKGFVPQEDGSWYLEGSLHSILAVPWSWFAEIGGSYYAVPRNWDLESILACRAKWMKSGLSDWGCETGPDDLGWKGKFYREIGVTLTIDCARGWVQVPPRPAPLSGVNSGWPYSAVARLNEHLRFIQDMRETTGKWPPFELVGGDYY